MLDRRITCCAALAALAACATPRAPAGAAPPRQPAAAKPLDPAQEALARGRSLGIGRRFEEAAPELERALALAPADATPWPVLAAVHVNRGDEVEARRAFDAAAAGLGKAPAVDRLWTMLLAMPPDPIAPQETLDRCTRGYAAMFEGRFPDAQQELLNGLKYKPDFSWCIALAAETTWRLGDAAGAERLFRIALAGHGDRTAPLRADAQAKLGALLLEKKGGSPKEAAELARASLAVRGDRAYTLDVLARACAAAGDAACARDASERLLRRPNLPAAMRAAAEERARVPTAAR